MARGLATCKIRAGGRRVFHVVADALRVVTVSTNDAAVLRAFAGRSSLSTYLTVVARRVAVRGLLRTVPVLRLDGQPRQPAAADGHLAGAEHRAEIETLLGRLAPDEARLVRLHHLEARSYDEISRLTGMPLNSIGPALSRARQKMRG